jgi:hypothetical protein
MHAVFNEFNSIHPNVQFTEEMEKDNQINYLDVNIHKTPTNKKFLIYRKPTFPDTSNNPVQHKYGPVRFLCNRLNSYRLHNEKYKHEENIIENILYYNSYLLSP